VADTVCDRIGFAQRFQQPLQYKILLLFKRHVIAAFKLDSNRKIITALSAAPLRRSGVPGTIATGYELQELAIAPDQKMRGHEQTGNLLEIRMCRRIKTVGEQIRNRIAAKTPGRQADAMNNSEFNAASGRARIAVRRRDLVRGRQHTGGVDYPAFPVHIADCIQLLFVLN